MVTRKVLAVLTVLSFAAVGVGNLIYVDVEDETSVIVPYHNMTVEDDRFILNTTVENTGSVGCTIRVHGRFRQNGTTYEAFSSPADLFPGAHDTVQLQYYPLNYTGPVEANFSVQYCGRAQHLNTTSFSVDTGPIPANEIGSRTIEVGDDRVTIEIGQEGLLLPVAKPGQWAVSHARARNGYATIEYDPPLFNPSKTMTFALFNQSTGEPEGTTEIVLKDQRTRLERFLADRTHILLLVSALTNLALLLLIGKKWREGKF